MNAQSHTKPFQRAARLFDLNDMKTFRLIYLITIYRMMSSRIPCSIKSNRTVIRVSDYLRSWK